MSFISFVNEEYVPQFKRLNIADIDDLEEYNHILQNQDKLYKDVRIESENYIPEQPAKSKGDFFVERVHEKHIILLSYLARKDIL